MPLGRLFVQAARRPIFAPQSRSDDRGEDSRHRRALLTVDGTRSSKVSSWPDDVVSVRCLQRRKALFGSGSNVSVAASHVNAVVSRLAPTNERSQA